MYMCFVSTGRSDPIETTLACTAEENPDEAMIADWSEMSPKIGSSE